MRSTGAVVASAAIFVLLVVFLAGERPASADYAYTEIMPPGWSYASATCINNSGAVAGWGDDGSGNQRGFIYQGGAYTTILPPNGIYCGGMDGENPAVNNNGVVAGYGEFCSSTQGMDIPALFTYSDGTYTTINVPSGWISIVTYGLNDNGVIVGGAGNANGNGWGFMYNPDNPDFGGFTEINPLGWTDVTAYAVNNNGVVAGWGTDPSGTSRGFLYNNGTYTTLAPDASFSEAWAINSGGVVAGDRDGPNGNEGFTYSGGAYSYFQIPNGGGSATAINSSGAVAGAFLYSPFTAFVHQKGTFTSILPPGWTSILYLHDINDSGALVGVGADANGATAGFVATPVLPQFSLAITKAGSGTGTVTSSPTGIACGETCSASFAQGTPATLTAKARRRLGLHGLVWGRMRGNGAVRLEHNRRHRRHSDLQEAPYCFGSSVAGLEPDLDAPPADERRLRHGPFRHCRLV